MAAIRVRESNAGEDLMGPPPAKRTRSQANQSNAPYCLRPLENRASLLRKKTVAAAGKLKSRVNNVKKCDESIPMDVNCGDATKTPENAWMTMPQPVVDLEQAVVDIDIEDVCDPLMFSVYIKDVFSYLFLLESQFEVSPLFMNKTGVSVKARKILVDWLVSVNRKYGHKPETLFLTVDIIDRYLQTLKSPLRLSKLQLVGCTALLIASKIEEIYPPSVENLVKMSDHSFSDDDLVSMERRVILALDFDFSRPTSFHFLKRFLKATSAETKAKHMAMYILELTLIESTFSSVTPSELAASSVLLALQITCKNAPTWDFTAQYYSRYSAIQLQLTANKLVALLAANDGITYKAVYDKYGSSEWGKVSHSPAIKTFLQQRNSKRTTALF